MRLVAGVVRVTADLERIVKYAFRISPMLGSCSFDFGIWIVAPSVSKMSRSQLNYAASPGGFVTSTNLINLRVNSAVVPFSRSQGRAFRAESSVAPEADPTAPPAWLVAPTTAEPTSRAAWSVASAASCATYFTGVAAALGASPGSSLASWASNSSTTGFTLSPTTGRASTGWAASRSFAISGRRASPTVF